jgi:hypothetical protein
MSGVVCRPEQHLAKVTRFEPMDIQSNSRVVPRISVRTTEIQRIKRSHVLVAAEGPLRAEYRCSITLC